MRTTTYHACSRISTPRLNFRQITLDDIPRIAPFLDKGQSRTCDYTIGGIYMWIDYFNYRYCIHQNTLFIQGVDENDLNLTAYSLPLGELSVNQSVEILSRHCRLNGHKLRFSAIPEDKLPLFAKAGPSIVEELTNWSDYLYDAQALSSLAGNRLKKKRNHVNRFLADNPQAKLEPLSHSNIPEAKELLTRVAQESDDFSILASVERSQVYAILNSWPGIYDHIMHGACLRNNSGSIVAFTIGEIIGDTLFVHIEKMDHSIPGAGETINQMFARYITSMYPQVLYINREEDVGDEGLRAAKLSYHPLQLLRKFNVVF